MDDQPWYVSLIFAAVAIGLMLLFLFLGAEAATSSARSVDLGGGALKLSEEEWEKVEAYKVQLIRERIAND